MVFCFYLDKIGLLGKKLLSDLLLQPFTYEIALYYKVMI